MSLPTVAMILYPQFNPIHFAMTYAVFSAEVDGAPLFDLKIVAPNKAAQKAERALHAQADGGLALLAAADIVVVPGWHDINEPPSQQLVAAFVLIRSSQKHRAQEQQRKVDGVPVSAEVRVLLRNHPNKDYDMLVVAKVQSANDGTWEIHGLNPNFKYDVIARYTGYNDLIMSDLTPKV